MERQAERERLVELQCLAYDTFEGGKTSFEHTADVLLANGVIVPPCKVGDTVYLPFGKSAFDAKVICMRPFATYDGVEFRGDIEYEAVGPFYTDGRKERFKTTCIFGKDAYLTREETENALKGGAGR